MTGAPNLNIEKLADIAPHILKYFEKVESISKHFVEAISSLNSFNLDNAYKSLAKSIKLDTEADNLRRDIMAYIARAPLDNELKEYLSRLLRMMDRLSEWLKEASRYLDIIPYLEIPPDIRTNIENLAKINMEAIRVLKDAAHRLLKNGEDVSSMLERVEKFEEEADEINHDARKKLVFYGTAISNPALVVMLRDFIESLENVTDYAEDVADVLRVLMQYLFS